METVELPDRPDPQRWVIAVAVLCVIVALGGGFTAGWVSHERSTTGQFREQIADATVCVLDVLIEPPPGASPEVRYEVWPAARLVRECGLTPESVSAIRDD